MSFSSKNTISPQQQEFDEIAYVKIITDNMSNPNPNPEPKDDNNINKNIQTMKLNSKAMSEMSIKSLSLGKNNMLFNENDGIEKSIIKIEKMDENDKFSCD